VRQFALVRVLRGAKRLLDFDVLPEIRIGFQPGGHVSGRPPRR
jgi:hypothetical protein